MSYTCGDSTYPSSLLHACVLHIQTGWPVWATGMVTGCPCKPSLKHTNSGYQLSIYIIYNAVSILKLHCSVHVHVHLSTHVHVITETNQEYFSWQPKLLLKYAVEQTGLINYLYMYMYVGMQLISVQYSTFCVHRHCFNISNKTAWNYTCPMACLPVSTCIMK